MIRLVVFVVLMILWLVFGIMGIDRNNLTTVGGTLIPWICVAILGYEAYKDSPVR